MSKDQILDSVRGLLSQAGYSPADADAFVAALSQYPLADVEEMKKLFSSSPELTRKLGENYRARKLATESGNMEAWRRIIAEEKRLLTEADREADTS